jgi:hypothetical protein
MLIAPLLALALAAGEVPPEAPEPVSVHFGSLQGGETLGAGGTVAVFTGGYSTVSAAYAQGFSAGADYGFQLVYDWTLSELVLGGLYRQLLWRSGDLVASWRTRAGFYGDLGATWIASANRSDAGVQVQPGVAVSAPLAGGLLSLGFDAPVDLTFSRGGIALRLQGDLAFEEPFSDDLSLGGRVGLGSRWSSSGAPLGGDSPRAVYDFSVVLTYQLL